MGTEIHVCWILSAFTEKQITTKQITLFGLRWWFNTQSTYTFTRALVFIRPSTAWICTIRRRTTSECSIWQINPIWIRCLTRVTRSRTRIIADESRPWTIRTGAIAWLAVALAWFHWIFATSRATAICARRWWCRFWKRPRLRSSCLCPPSATARSRTVRLGLWSARSSFALLYVRAKALMVLAVSSTTSASGLRTTTWSCMPNRTSCTARIRTRFRMLSGMWLVLHIDTERQTLWRISPTSWFGSAHDGRSPRLRWRWGHQGLITGRTGRMCSRTNMQSYLLSNNFAIAGRISVATLLARTFWMASTSSWTGMNTIVAIYRIFILVIWKCVFEENIVRIFLTYRYTIWNALRKFY